MFRLYLLIASSYSVRGWGSGLGGDKEACYGSDFTLPLSELGSLRTHLFFFTPAKGGEKIQILLENGTSLDPHYEISSSRQLIIREVTERDEGVFSSEFPAMSDLTLSKIRLKIKDCSAKVTAKVLLGANILIPNNAYSLEFTPLNSANDPPELLWHRTDNTGVRERAGRGRRVNKEWQIVVDQPTQQYNGYYTFRNQKRKIVSRIKMTVEAQHRDVFVKAGADIRLMYINLNVVDVDLNRFDLTFLPFTTDLEPVVLMKAGNLLTGWETDFSGRIQLDDRDTFLDVLLLNVRPSDSGQYKLIDQEGHPAIIVELKVEEKIPPYLIYVGVAAGILLAVLICCCCVKKCCKKTTRKQDVRQTEAAPAVYYYGDNTRPSSSALPTSSYGPTYSYPLYPIEPGPGSTHHQALVPGPENHLGSSQPEVVASTASHEPASTTFLGVDALPPDAEPQFELKGMFSSVLPLSSQASYNDVYSSDKLNFL